MNNQDFMTRLWAATNAARSTLIASNGAKYSYLDSLTGKPLLAAMPSATKGRIGEHLVAGILTDHYGLDVTLTPRHPLHDMTMTGFAAGVQVKFATESSQNQFIVGGLKPSDTPHLMVLLPSASFTKSNCAAYRPPMALAIPGMDVNRLLREHFAHTKSFQIPNVNVTESSPSSRAGYLASLVTSVPEAFETFMSRLAF